MDKHTIDSLKQHGLISDLEDLPLTLGHSTTSQPLEGAFIPASPLRFDVPRLLTAKELMELQGFDAPTTLVTTSPPCAGHSKPIKEGFQFTPELKREFALARGAIMTITTAELDDLLLPYMQLGLLHTDYNSTTRATKYHGPDGDLIALSVGKRHFCRRIDGPMASVSQYMQVLGRIERKPQPVHWELFDPKTGEKIPGSEFTTGGDQ